MTRKKRFSAIFLACALVFSALACFSAVHAQPAISARSAILIDADSSIVLFEHNAHERMGMASTTKIMTALTVVRLTDTSRIVRIPKEAVGIEGSSVYLCEGEQMTVEQLLYAMLLASANDAATALAIVCSGSVEKFAEEMNAYADELGLKNTHFVNPHGLADENHYTTAYDLAAISRAALENELLRAIFATYKKELPFEGEECKRLVVNHNKLLRSYDGAIGMKTGFTRVTGRCLVSAAERDGLTLICVTLDAPDDWRDHTAMLDYGFENYMRYAFADIGEFEYSLPLVGGISDTVTLTNTEPLYLTVRRGTEKDTVCTVISTYRFIYAPVTEAYVCGEVEVACDGQTSCSSLVVCESIPSRGYKKSLWQKIKDILKRD